MAVKIEKGGWVLIFAIGLGLVGYSLNKYGVIDFGGMFGSRPSRTPAAAIDPSKPLVLPPSGTPETKDVRLRVNIWVGCVGGLVANGGLDTATESIYGNKGLKVSFKIIDDWTEGATAPRDSRGGGPKGRHAPARSPRAHAADSPRLTAGSQGHVALGGGAPAR